MQVFDFDKWWNYKEPAETAIKFKELLTSENNKALNDVNYRLQLLSQLARTQSLQFKFDEAHQYLDSIEKEFHNTAVNACTKTRFFLEKGRTYNSAKVANAASEFFMNAYDTATKHGLDFYAIDAAHMLAIAAQNTDQKIYWNEMALNIAEKTNNIAAARWKASLYNNIGWDYFAIKKYNKALAYFKRAETLHKKNKDKAIHPFLIAQWCVAKTLRLLGKVAQSLQMQLSIMEAYNTSNLQETGYVSEELGELYLLKNENEKAKFHFANAYRLLSLDKWLLRNEPERLERIKTLSLGFDKP